MSSMLKISITTGSVAYTIISLHAIIRRNKPTIHTNMDYKAIGTAIESVLAMIEGGAIHRVCFTRRLPLT